jgi:hypothetical protein
MIIISGILWAHFRGKVIIVSIAVKFLTGGRARD